MTAASLFSGVGAPELAMPGWNWLWHAEIEKFPSAVMAARFPHSVNLGDVTADDFAERALAIGRPDVLVFGSPCQSYSVAGKRLGLDDPRGNLALVALRLVQAIQPQWFVFENVPGLLSSASGSDFGIFLRTVEDCGYFGAWASLDAQYFGLAQRRKRLFFVGCLGDWRGPAAILLEPDSLCGDSPTRPQEGQSPTYPLAPCVDASGVGFARTGDKRGQDPVIAIGCEFGPSGGRLTETNPTLDSRAKDGPIRNQLAGAVLISGRTMNGDDVAPTLDTTHDRKWGSNQWVNNGFGVIAHPLRGEEGFDASKDGTGRGTPLVPVHIPELAGTLTSGGNGERGRLDPVNTDLVAYGFANTAGETRQGFAEEQAPPITTRHGDPGMVLSVALRGRDGGATAELGGEVATALRASGGGGDKPHILTQAVRRLMPVETERLQGFPDGHTAITYRGKPAADGPRYKAIGNSMAVPVVRWILSRLEIVDGILNKET